MIFGLLLSEKLWGCHINVHCMLSGMINGPLLYCLLSAIPMNGLTLYMSNVSLGCVIAHTVYGSNSQVARGKCTWGRLSPLCMSLSLL
jgi:hypothetical protein